MATIHIDTYDRSYLDRMTSLFNQVTKDEPHVAPLTPDRFIALVESKSYFDPEGLFVVVQDGQVIGWVHACVAAGSEPHHDPKNRVGRIRMLIFPKDKLLLGNRLVTLANEWLDQNAQGDLLAMHAQVGYPFYRGIWFGGEPMGPASLPHLQIAFEVGGFKATQESIFLTAEMANTPEEVVTSVAIEFQEAQVEMTHEPMRESWIGFEPLRTSAYLDGEEVGSIGWVLEPHLERLGAPCMNIWGLGVREHHRRKGIASALLSRAMVHSYAQGARFASVGTQLWNAPAHATYARFGFCPSVILIGRTRQQDKRKETER
jgi:GNAT superfamily N-acetyltransferase